jgi:hypothetical protein
VGFEEVCRGTRRAASRRRSDEQRPVGVGDLEATQRKSRIPPRAIRDSKLCPRLGAQPQPLGVYQMGEVKARSWSFIVTFGSAFSPKNFASYAVHRGVGISITRP